MAVTLVFLLTPQTSLKEKIINIVNQKRKLEIQSAVYKVKYVECRSRDGEKIKKVKFLDYEVI